MEPSPNPVTDAPAAPQAADPPPPALDPAPAAPGQAPATAAPGLSDSVSPAAPTDVRQPLAAGPPPAIEPAELDLRWPYIATGLSALLLFASFHPMDRSGLAWVALVPWLVVAAISGGRVAVAVSYATTALYHLVGLSWIGLVSPAGWLVTTFLEGFYGIALAMIPLMVRRRTGLPLALVLPIVGTALELARGNTPVIRFPWLLLGQTQAATTNLAQIADLASVYGLTFLVLAVNGGIVDALLLLRARWLQGREPDSADRQRLAAVLLLPLLLVGLAWGYGVQRRSTVQEATRPGPLVLVVQPDLPQSLKDEASTADTVAYSNLNITARALDRRRQTRDVPPLDLIVWSETMWPWPIPDEHVPGGREAWDAWMRGLERRNPNYASLVRDFTRRLFQVATESRATLIVGAVHDPAYLAGRERGSPELKPHNSVYAISPEGRVVARYDKINLVPASEYIPGEGTTLFGWVPKLVQSFIPEGFTFLSFEPGPGPVLVPVPTNPISPAPGAAPTAAPQAPAPAPEHRAAINVCFEISFPELLRRSVEEGASFHVCPANDGWFVRGGVGYAQETAELRLARDHARLRAIEGRRPVVRCVNRGVSLVLDPVGDVGPDDQVYEVRAGKMEVVGIDGYVVSRLPTTELRTFYVRHGDVFAWGCVLGSIVLVVLGRRGQRLLRPVEEGGVEPPPPAGPLASTESEPGEAPS